MWGTTAGSSRVYLRNRCGLRKRSRGGGRRLGSAFCIATTAMAAVVAIVCIGVALLTIARPYRAPT